MIIDGTILENESVASNWKGKEASVLQGTFLKKEQAQGPIQSECFLIEYYAQLAKLRLADSESISENKYVLRVSPTRTVESKYPAVRIGNLQDDGLR